MNKELAISKVLDILYSGSSRPLLSQNQVKAINEEYKKKYKSFDNILSYLSLSTNKNEILSIPSIKAEIESKLIINKALQPGVISECNLSDYIARKVGLDKCSVLRNGLDANESVKTIMIKNNLNINKCRYVYYSSHNGNYLFQYGDPQSCDAVLIFGNNLINLEYKERAAKAGEYDLRYNRNGELFLTEKFKTNNPELIGTLQPMLDSFNAKTNIFDNRGKNFKEFSNYTKISAICGYFISKKIDILVSLDNLGNVVAIVPEWIDLNYELDTDKNAFTVISAEGSEIRATGKNPAKISFPDLFKNDFIQCGGVINNCNCSISANNNYVKVVKSRGKDEDGLLKIHSMYEVPLKGDRKAVLENDKWTFNLNDVREKNPTVSPHITVIAQRQDIIDKLLRRQNKSVQLDIIQEEKHNNIEDRQNKYESAIKNDWSTVSSGSTVKHPIFGVGTVTAIDKNNKKIAIRFNAIERYFHYPEAFEQGYLKAKNQ